MKIKSLIFSLFAAMVLFVACDVISEDDRLIELSKPLTDRTALLIEFTGNRCPNCPGAAMIADELLDTIPNNVVVVAMHPAGLSFTEPFSPKVILQSKEAYDYLGAYEGNVGTALPVGVVNNRKFDKDGYLLGSSTWTAKVFEQCYIESECLIDLQHSLEGDNHTVTATLSPKGSLAPVSLVFWLVESNIVGPQNMSHALLEDYKANHPDAEVRSGAVMNYVHNHVFRSTLNGLWGEELGAISAETEKGCTFAVDAKYVADNCAVVAVLINTETKEVVQAAEIALGAGAAH